MPLQTNLVQWGRLPPPKRLPAAKGTPLQIVISCGTEFLPPDEPRGLAVPRGPDVTDKWRFIGGRASDRDIEPPASPRWEEIATPEGPAFRVWDKEGRFIGTPSWDMAMKAVHDKQARDARGAELVVAEQKPAAPMKSTWWGWG